VVEFFHIFEASVNFHRAGECEIGESQILLHLFVAHTILPSFVPTAEFVGFMAREDD
jgi:hypothetical protein